MAAIPLVFAFLCLTQVPALGQGTEPPWHWIMADSRNATLVCPGRCLAVNDSAYPGDYQDKEVAFGPCRSTSSDSSDRSNNNNQQWFYDGPGAATRIRINASEADPPAMLCLQPRGGAPGSRVGLTVASCGAESDKNQTWIVANDSIASLAFDPPLRLAMRYQPSDDGAWRRASLVRKTEPGSTGVFSMVPYTEDIRSFPPLNISDMTPDSANFLQNGGFERSSFDFPRNVTEIDADQDKLFAVCHWVVEVSGVQLLEGSAAGMPPKTEGGGGGGRALLLKDGIFMQIAQTRRGATYTLAFNMAVARAEPSSSGEACNGTDAVSVNPFPSTNVRVDLSSRSSGSWEAKHFGFQAVGAELQVTFMGCSACGCYLDDVNLMQTSDPLPLPSPPPMRPRPPPPPPDSDWPYPRWRPLAPPPPQNRSTKPEPPDPQRPTLEFPHGGSRKLSNGAVAGLLVGSSVVFFLMGAACFGVLGLAKQAKPAPEMGMVRPPEWSIQTTTPPRSSGRGGGSQQSSSKAASLPVPASPHPRPDPSPPSSNVAKDSTS